MPPRKHCLSRRPSCCLPCPAAFPLPAGPGCQPGGGGALRRHPAGHLRWAQGAVAPLHRCAPAVRRQPLATPSLLSEQYKNPMSVHLARSTYSFDVLPAAGGSLLPGLQLIAAACSLASSAPTAHVIPPSPLAGRKDIDPQAALLFGAVAGQAGVKCPCMLNWVPDKPMPSQPACTRPHDCALAGKDRQPSHHSSRQLCAYTASFLACCLVALSAPPGIFQCHVCSLQCPASRSTCSEGGGSLSGSS